MSWIKKAYLYVVSLVSLIIIIVGATMLVNMGLKTVLGVADYKSYPQQACVSQPPTPSGVKDVVCDPEYIQKQEEYDRQNQRDQKKRDAAQALAFILVGSPVFWYHWKLARQEV